MKKPIGFEKKAQEIDIREAIKVAKRQNDDCLPKSYVFDFGLAIASEISQKAFVLTVLDAGDLIFAIDRKNKEKFLTLTFTPKQIVLPAEIMSIVSYAPHIITMEVYGSGVTDFNLSSQIECLTNGLTQGLKVRANWNARFNAFSGYNELIVPINLTSKQQSNFFLSLIY